MIPIILQHTMKIHGFYYFQTTTYVYDAIPVQPKMHELHSTPPSQLLHMVGKHNEMYSTSVYFFKFKNRDFLMHKSEIMN